MRRSEARLFAQNMGVIHVAVVPSQADVCSVELAVESTGLAADAQCWTQCGGYVSPHRYRLPIPLLRRIVLRPLKGRELAPATSCRVPLRFSHLLIACWRAAPIGIDNSAALV
jgi:hypothetical protein